MNNRVLPFKVTPRTIGEWKNLYWKGTSVRGIAEKYGCAYGTVHRRLKDAGVKFRKRGGSNHEGRRAGR